METYIILLFSPAPAYVVETWPNVQQNIILNYQTKDATKSTVLLSKIQA